MSQTPINMSDVFYIDEEGLLPGTEEPTETSGLLNFSPDVAHSLVRFAPLSDQETLKQLALKSQGNDLHYELSHHDQLLTAKIGQEGPVAFTVQLENDGHFTFTLNQPIDRQLPHNMINDEWVVQETHTVLFQENIQKELKTPISNIFQEISTQPDAAYQISFFHQPKNGSEHVAPVKLYWGDQLLHEFHPEEQQAKGYIFTVEGDPHLEKTKLQFIGEHAESFYHDCIGQLCLINTAQNQLPLDFTILTFADAQATADPAFYGYFTVNVTTTPPIQVNNHEPFDIVYEQAIYQTIIVNDDNTHHNPLTRINFDALFKNLDIPNENRHVEVVQREEDGHVTNVYEVKISDKSHTYEPITVADVQLSFPGGDGGLAVFLKNVYIDEGHEGNLPGLNLTHYEV